MRKIWDIPGGIHPAENKTQSNQQPIRSAGIPELLIFPLSQHIGAPAEAIVEVGQRVLKGQKIAEAKGFVSVPVHASTSGEVVAIESRAIPHPSGLSGRCIVIKPDQQDQWIEHSGVENPLLLDKAELLARIREAGIAGMGGAGFPSSVKLSTREDQPIESLIINGTECEPYITADDVLMRERADEVIAGVNILRHLIKPNKETLIGVEDNKPEAAAALRQAAQGSEIEVVTFPTKYPSGGEKQLIQILTGKEVPSGGLPAQVGVVVQNVGTAVAIERAIHHGEPLIERVTTVTGESCANPQNYDVLLGTPVEHLLKLSGFDAAHCDRLILGGPMMGYAIESDQIPVVKTTNCVLAPSRSELPEQPHAQACIRCGMCAEACPASLLPQQMYWFSRGQEWEKLDSHNVADCIECGACSFVCPSNIPLVQYFRAGKSAIREAEQDRIKAEQSKIRFEARQQRIEREAAEKEAKRKARAEAAKAKAAADAAAQNDTPDTGGDGKSDIIAAAIARTKAKKEASADPAQAAIERAKAKRSGKLEESPEEQLTRLKKAVSSGEKRLAAAKEKLSQAEAESSDQVDIFRTAVEKTEGKLASAREELEQFQQSQSKAPAQPAATGDAAQDAIERAKAAREAAANMSEEEKAQQALESLKKRLAKAEQRLQKAEQEEDDNLEVFRSTVEKLREKLAAQTQTQPPQAPEETKPQPAPAPEPKSDSSDPAQAAIERAKAARDAQASMSPREKLENSISSMEKRIANTSEKLTQAEADGSDNAEILASSLEKMKLKLDQARADLAAMD